MEEMEEQETIWMMISHSKEKSMEGPHPLDKNPLSLQVGGGHYKSMAIQPVEYCQKNKLNFIESCIVKYISRHREKNGKEDLLKIKHFVDLLIELEYKDGSD